MITETTERHFIKNGIPIIEVATFAFLGEGDDKRSTTIGKEINGIDKWVLLSVVNPAYSYPPLNFRVVTEQQLNENTLEIEEMPVSSVLIQDEAYYNSPYWHPHKAEIKEGFAKVSREERLEAKRKRLEVMREVKKKRKETRGVAAGRGDNATQRQELS